MGTSKKQKQQDDELKNIFSKIKRAQQEKEEEESQQSKDDALRASMLAIIQAAGFNEDTAEKVQKKKTEKKASSKRVSKKRESKEGTIDIIIDRTKGLQDFGHEDNVTAINDIQDNVLYSSEIKHTINTHELYSPQVQNNHVLIGKDNNYKEVYWEFGNDELPNRHMLITGTSGQGKTYSVQTMLYELSKTGVASIIFDYTEGFRQDQLETDFLNKMKNKIKQHIVYNSGVPINPFKRQEIEVAGTVMLEKISDIAVRVASIFKHVYNFGDQQFAVVFDAVRIGMEEYGNSMNMRLFKNILEKESANKNKVAQSVLAKMTPFFHSIEFNETDDFDWGDIIYSESADLNIFQLTSIDREMQVIITEFMLWDAWYYTKKYGNKDKPFVVVLDEAQNLSHKANSPSATILTEGRKFGWSAWFATQSIKILSDDEITRLMQAETKLYFKPTDDEMSKMAKQLDLTKTTMWVKTLKNLQKGQCIVVGDSINESGRLVPSTPVLTAITPFEKRE